jgi:choline-sulfatase
LFILSDEHNRKISRAYGHPFVQTPNIDRLAAEGTSFNAAYTNSPICVPARAALATGQHVHEIGCWDNASPYDGTIPSWHHVLRDAGVDVVSVGKLHFRGGDDYGFTEELLPLHIVGGKGDLKGLLRRELPTNMNTFGLAANAGRGDSDYFDYDTRIVDCAKDWLERRASDTSGKRFALFVSFVMPHFPLRVPAAYYDLYADYSLDDLRAGLNAPPPDHPALARMRRFFNYDDHFDDEKRAVALRAYFGMVTRVDEMIGELVRTLEVCGMQESTRVIYTSDHGDNLGNRGMWGKSNMYEDSVSIPLIVAGRGVPAGKRVNTPVSLVDIAPTATHAAGVAAYKEWTGHSLIDFANRADVDRVVLSEYHAAGSDTGQFMIRRGPWKYIAFVHEGSQLFNLDRDPDELENLADDPALAETVRRMQTLLAAICDPEKVSAQAFSDQRARIEKAGGKDAILQSVDIPFTPAP